MKELCPNHDLLLLLSQYNAAGGAIDYVIMDPESDSRSSYAVHREVAIFGLRTIFSRWESSGPRPDPFIRLKLGPLGISLRTLFGFRKTIKPALRVSDYSWPGEEGEIHPERVDGKPIDAAQFLNGGPMVGAGVKGYRYAFYDPPYPLKLPPFGDREMTRPELDQLFQGINEHLNSGHQWWGAFLWTVRRDMNSPLIWIGASASD